MRIGYKGCERLIFISELSGSLSRNTKTGNKLYSSKLINGPCSM